MSRKRLGNSLKDRVAHAYFKYGRFCSSHPVLCMLVSIFTLLFLSYPVTRLRLPTSSPLDVYWADNSHEKLDRTDKPEWLSVAAPRLYVQQILLQPKIDPWDPKKVRSAELAVKGALSKAFKLKERLNEISFDSKNLEKFCFTIHNSPTTDLLPALDCLILSPALFWENDIEKFYEDAEILKTIFGPSCTSAMCVRDLLFGLPTRMTGIKRQFRTNRERKIDFAFTIVLLDYDANFWKQIRNYFNSSSSEFFLADSESEQKFVHIFYRPRKELSEYIPLAVSYLFLLIYVYFSVSKIEMVKSKWGLAFSAVFTVAASLIMAAGICFQFDLTPTLWGAELFPYLAMIVGLENTLCITRSVVWTPVSMDVRSRIAHGLSKEGWSITKNFLTELLIITVGFFTFLPEIQEFCTFACIGLVVDFYMQLFFYAPCLTFDLFRMEAEDKDPIQLRQLTGSPVELEVYPGIQCPVASVFPRFFPRQKVEAAGNRMTRVKSESGLMESDKCAVSSTGPPQGHRRTASNTSDIFVDVEPRHVLRVLPTHVPKRLRVLYFWANTRFFQRFIMVVTVLWIVWLAFIVHELQLMGQVSSIFRSPAEKATHDSSETAQNVPEPPLNAKGFQEWGSWQRKTFKWWPVLFDQYNISLSGHYLTILPPVILKATVPPDDPSIVASGGHEKPDSDQTSSDPTEEQGKKSGPLSFLPNSDLPLKISWLELQMRIVLLMSFGIFATVAAFILLFGGGGLVNITEMRYVCFAGRGSSRNTEDTAQWTQGNRSTHKRVGSRAIVESVPLVFEGHDQDVECVCLWGQDVVASSCLGGSIRVWDGKTGDCLKNFERKQNLHSAGDSQAIARAVTTTPQSAAISDVPETDQIVRRRNPLSENRGHVRARNGGYDFTPFLAGRQQAAQNEQSAVAPLLIIDFDNEELRKIPIWCMNAQHNLIAVGCGNGCVELYSSSGAFLGLHSANIGDQGFAGVNQICLKGSRLVIARLNGTLEFLEMKLAQRDGGAEPKLQCHLLRQVRAHQHPINCLEIGLTNIVITGSSDHTLKLFDLRTCRVTHTLYGHNGSVMCVCVDEHLQVIYSSCDQGLICCWDLMDGTLLRTLLETSYTNASVALAVTSSLLVAYSSDCHLWLWQKRTGELVTRIRRETSEKNGTANSKREKMKKSNYFSAGCLSAGFCEVPNLVVLEGNDDFAVTAYAGFLQFWSLQYKILLREVKLETSGGAVHKLLMMNGDAPSVVCCKGKVLYRVNFPIIRFK